MFLGNLADLGMLPILDLSGMAMLFPPLFFFFIIRVFFLSD